MGTFITLLMGTVLQVYADVQMYQIVYIKNKNVYFKKYQLQSNKAIKTTMTTTTDNKERKHRGQKVMA